MNVTINQDMRVFVIPCGNNGYSTHGFDVVFNEAAKLTKVLAKKLKGVLLPAVNQDEIGTIAQYQIYRHLLEIAKNYELGTWYNAKTPVKVQKILEDYRKSGDMIRVFYGDTETGRDSMDEWDMVGCIGRSTGLLKIPLMIAEGEFSGCGLLDHCIVRMIDIASGKEVYRHKHYYQQEMRIVSNEHRADMMKEGLPFGVTVGGSAHANFCSYEMAASWIGFMSGNSQTNPSA